MMTSWKIKIRSRWKKIRHILKLELLFRIRTIRGYPVYRSLQTMLIRHRTQSECGQLPSFLLRLDLESTCYFPCGDHQSPSVQLSHNCFLIQLEKHGVNTCQTEKSRFSVGPSISIQGPLTWKNMLSLLFVAPFRHSLIVDCSQC